MLAMQEEECELICYGCRSIVNMDLEDFRKRLIRFIATLPVVGVENFYSTSI